MKATIWLEMKISDVMAEEVQRKVIDLCKIHPQPSSSRSQDQYHRNRPREVTPEDKAKQIIRNAELTKEQLLPKTGKNYFDYSTAVIDKTFFVVGSNLDLATIEKIQKGDYVDFGKLVPKDRVLVEEDKRLEIVIRNGRTFYVPVSDSTTISNCNNV